MDDARDNELVPERVEIVRYRELLGDEARDLSDEDVEETAGTRAMHVLIDAFANCSAQAVLSGRVPSTAPWLQAHPGFQLPAPLPRRERGGRCVRSREMSPGELAP